MGLWKSFAGIYTVEITSASVSDMLTAVSNCGVTLHNVTHIDDLHVMGRICRLDKKLLIDCLSRRGDSVKVTHKDGLFWSIHNLRKRPILAVGIILFLIAALYLPSRVFFVRVEGNHTIPQQMIVEKAQLCGIKFGASRREVRSEKMKNALLSAIPELQWAGVNTVGCVAVISVKERNTADMQTKTPRVSSIVAACDGIIREITVLRGNPLCTVGQAVKKGQLLVSGYIDCGLLIKTTKSEAEILAQTRHSLQAITMAQHITRGEQIAQETKYYLRIGKNIINFSKDSGISDATCVKMYTEKFLTLPGGFQLPIAFITEERIYFNQTQTSQSEIDNFEWVSEAVDAYQRERMMAGEIIKSDRTYDLQDGAYISYNNFSCVEMIGIVRNEELVESNGKRN